MSEIFRYFVSCMITYVALALLSSVYLIYRLRSHVIKAQMSTQISQRVVNLCRSSTSVSSRLAQNSSLSPSTVIKELFNHSGGDEGFNDSDGHFDGTDALETAYHCGKWGATRPSDLFLRASLLHLDHGHCLSKLSCLDIS